MLLVQLKSWRNRSKFSPLDMMALELAWDLQGRMALSPERVSKSRLQHQAVRQ